MLTYLIEGSPFILVGFAMGAWVADPSFRQARHDWYKRKKQRRT